MFYLGKAQTLRSFAGSLSFLLLLVVIKKKGVSIDRKHLIKKKHNNKKKNKNQDVKGILGY